MTDSNHDMSLFRRVDSADRGRHLVAARPISEGRLIFCERPLVALQSLGNPVWVCHCCKAFVGGPHHALRIMAHHEMPSPQQHYNAAIEEDENDEGSSWKVVPCRQNCGQVYCSSECEQDFWHARHRFLCTGRLPELPESQTPPFDQPPLLQFKRHAVETNEIFLLVAEWIAAAHTYSDSWEISGSQCDEATGNVSPYDDFCHAPWWELDGGAPCPESSNDKTSYTKEENATSHPETAIEETAPTINNVLKALCEESCQLLKKHWSSSEWSVENNAIEPSVSDNCRQHLSGKTTPLSMANIIGACELNSIGIRRRNPVCREIFSRDIRQQQKQDILQCLHQAGMLDSKGLVSGNLNLFHADWEYTDDDLAQFFADLIIFEGERPKDDADGELESNNGDAVDSHGEEIVDKNDDCSNGSDCCRDQDDLDHIFSPLDGTAMYALACKMNHSCEPNVAVLYRTRGWGSKHPLVVHCMALRAIGEGEELCISYIDEHAPVEERQRELMHYGFHCECDKCKREQQSNWQGSSSQATNGTGEGAPNLGLDEGDFLFGTDSEGDDVKETKNSFDKNGGKITNHSLNRGENNGENALQKCLSRLDTDLSHVSMGSIPLPFLAPVLTFTIQTASRVCGTIGDCNDARQVQHLLDRCIFGLRERDFVLCKTVGADLERFLFSMLTKDAAWPSVSYREAYWCGALAASIGLANQVSFLHSLEFLDKAIVLGLKRSNVQAFFGYVERHAAQLVTGPCPPVLDVSTIPDYTLPDHIESLNRTGLAHPIYSAIPELDGNEINSIAGYFAESKAFAIRRYAANWDALTKWRNFGHRLVPVELGTMKGESGMKEELMAIRQFVSRYLVKSSEKLCWSLQDANSFVPEIAYLAQHPLIDQIPELGMDINATPTICGKSGPTHIYLWVGTGGTRTPLHFDSYDNMFVQIVGSKYVRIYGASETENLYVSRGGKYSLQGNMSDIDCEQEDFTMYPRARNASYQEVLLLPGDALIIPAKTWHYVRSLSTSISVNFWF